MRDLNLLSNDEFGLYFDTERNLRYYQRRTGHYRRLHFFNSTLNVLFAGAAVVTLGSGNATGSVILQFVAVLAAVLNVLDIVLRFSERAAELNTICCQWGDLNRLAKSLQPDDAEAWADLERKIDAQNLSEPKPFYRALDVKCQAEALAAMGRGLDESYELMNRWERFSAAFRVHDDLGIKLQKRAAKKRAKQEAEELKQMQKASKPVAAN